MKKQISGTKYVAVFEPAEEGGFNVLFPDFPGCVTFGETLEEAYKHAREVLELGNAELCTMTRLAQ